jgi:hypothetical protein
MPGGGTPLTMLISRGGPHDVIYSGMVREDNTANLIYENIRGI